MNEPISDLFVSALTWAGKNGAEGAASRPGLWTGQTVATDHVPSLDVRLNAHLEQVEDMPPVTIRMTPAAADEPIAICVCYPFGGMLTGFTEDALLAHFGAQP
jgi:hypothetical protein